MDERVRILYRFPEEGAEPAFPRPEGIREARNHVLVRRHTFLVMMLQQVMSNVVSSLFGGGRRRDSSWAC